MTRNEPTELRIDAGAAVPLDATLWMPEGSRSLVVVAHGSGSRHGNPRSTYLADVLGEHGIGALLLNLLTPGEEAIDAMTADLRFDVCLLGQRLTATVDEVRRNPWLKDRHLGLLGASAGAAAALVAASRRPRDVLAVVSAGGRPDLAAQFLRWVMAPTRLIVAAGDEAIFRRNLEASERMQMVQDLQVIPGATQLFEEPAALATVARLASEWFATHLEAERATRLRRIAAEAEQRTA